MFSLNLFICVLYASCTGVGFDDDEDVATEGLTSDDDDNEDEEEEDEEVEAAEELAADLVKAVVGGVVDAEVVETGL